MTLFDRALQETEEQRAREGEGRDLEEKERLRYYDIDEKTTVH